MDRVHKLLSNYGYCSRRKAEELIKQGKVTVNGKKITIGDKAKETDEIRVDGELVEKDKRRYLKFNKPLGCVTSLNDKHEKTIMEYIDVKQRVYPVGRLDKDTSGLLILTNDGDFANKIMHPRYETDKTYLVTLNKPINEKIIEKIESGVVLSDGKTSACEINRKTANVLKITIHEGKNRIVRRIFEKFGFTVVTLKRTEIGKLRLGDLKPGEYRELTKKERELIFSS